MMIYMPFKVLRLIRKKMPYVIKSCLKSQKSITDGRILTNSVICAVCASVCASGGARCVLLQELGVAGVTHLLRVDGGG